ncbi:hypothetical protein PHLGIDRAFT_77692, partial [Phlebiopsis gigantea 11061_1 CR5-6]
MGNNTPISSLIRWTSPEGRALVRKIITGTVKQWPTGPYEHQVSSWVQGLEGISQIVSAPTGGGKTSYFFGPIIIAQYMHKNPVPGFKSFPAKPVAVVVVPLIELGNNHVREAEQLGLRAIALHAAEIARARREGRNLYTEIKACQWPLVFLSPERLTSREIDDIFRDTTFRANVILLGLDEVHVLPVWGKEFRTAYQNMAVVHRRLPKHVPLIGTSATIAPGKEFKSICSMLDLKPGQFYTQRLSNERPNVRSVVHELTHTLSGYEFPDLAWVLHSGRKVVLYCRTIDLGFRVALYLWNLFPPGKHRLHRVRLWNSLTSETYNTKTLELFQDNPETTAIVATIAFGMGINVRNIIDVCNVGVPESLGAAVQQDGRAGRDPNLLANGRTYVEAAALAAIREVLDAEFPDRPQRAPKVKAKSKTTTKRASKETVEKMDDGLRKLLVAHVEARCLVVEKNKVYGNDQLPDGVKAALPCSAASRLLPCSSCQPFWENISSPVPPPP